MALSPSFCLTPRYFSCYTSTPRFSKHVQVKLHLTNPQDPKWRISGAWRCSCSLVFAFRRLSIAFLSVFVNITLRRSTWLNFEVRLKAHLISGDEGIFSHFKALKEIMSVCLLICKSLNFSIRVLVWQLSIKSTHKYLLQKNQSNVWNTPKHSWMFLQMIS